MQGGGKVGECLEARVLSAALAQANYQPQLPLAVQPSPGRRMRMHSQGEAE